MKLTAEQKADLIKHLSLPWGEVKLICDGRHITLQVRAVSALTYRIFVYVDGWFKGEWMSEGNKAPESKFLNKVERPLYKPSEIAKMEKIFGKRAVQNDPRYSIKSVYYRGDFASGKAAIHHLCRVCESVEATDQDANVVRI